jgi:hypothetical protein
MSITKYTSRLGIIYKDAELRFSSVPLVLRLNPPPVESDKLVEEVVVFCEIVRMFNYFFKLPPPKPPGDTLGSVTSIRLHACAVRNDRVDEPHSQLGSQDITQPYQRLAFRITAARAAKRWPGDSGITVQDSGSRRRTRACPVTSSAQSRAFGSKSAPPKTV